MTDILKLEILGEPVTWSPFMKGRMTAKGIKRWKKLTNWQDIIYKEALDQLPNDFWCWEGALFVCFVIFRLTKPKSNKDKWPITQGDLDRLENALWDALEGLIYTNDRRIVYKNGVQKIWATPEKPPGISLQIERMK